MRSRGVINVILRKNFSGIDVGIGGGRTTHDDGTRRHVEATVGQSGTRGNLTLNTQFDKNDPIQQRDRDWSRNRVLDIEPNGTLTVTRNPGGIATFASPGFTDPASGRRSTRWIADGSGAYHLYGTADRFDLSTGSQLTVGQERIGANLLGSLKPTDDVEAYTRILYNHRKSTTEKNGATLGSTPVTLKYPNGFLVPASAPGNPFGRPLTLSKVFEQLGNQTAETDSGNLQSLVGLRGLIARRFAWDASFSDGRVRETFRTRNALNFTHAEQEVGQVPCSAADVAQGCVAGDMFGPSSLSPAALDYLRYTSVSHAVFTQRAFESSITGDLFDLPYRPAAGALGTTWRRLSGRFDPASVTLAGDQQGADTAPTAGSYDAKEVFAELKLPLLARLPGVRELDATFATRYAHYSNAGGHVTWKAALDWQVNEDVRFRASHSTGLRAPSISELFLGKTSVSAAFSDPCDATAGQRSKPVVAANCATAGVPANYAQPTNNYNTLLGGNAKLRPETSSNWNIGMVVTPATIPGLAVTVDYWNIHLRDAIGALNPTTILQTCYASPNLSDPLCGLIGPRGTILGNLTTLTDLEANQGRIRTDGLDLNAAYTFPLRAIGISAPGKITLQGNGTLTFNNRQQLTAGGPEIQLAGTVDQPTSSTNPGAIPRIRYNTSVSWANDTSSMRLGTRYIGPVYGARPGPFDREQPHRRHHLHGSRRHVEDGTAAVRRWRGQPLQPPSAVLRRRHGEHQRIHLRLTRPVLLPKGEGSLLTTEDRFNFKGDVMKMKCMIRKNLRLSAIALGVSLALSPLAWAADDDHSGNRIKHVLLISVDGMHQVDLDRYVSAHPGSAFARLIKHGVQYTRASTSKPSDSFPGLLAFMTGGSPLSHGVFYDDTYDRTLFAPGSQCKGQPGTETMFAENIDYDLSKLDGGGPAGSDHINVANLPLRLVGGQCVPVYPAQLPEGQHDHGSYPRSRWQNGLDRQAPPPTSSSAVLRAKDSTSCTRQRSIPQRSRASEAPTGRKTRRSRGLMTASRSPAS